MPVDKDKTVRTSVIVPADIDQRVQELAENDVSAAWIVRHALMEFLSAHTEEKAIPLKLGGANARTAAARRRKRS